MTSAKRPAADWERIELEFRAGVLSVREIAGTYGVSHVAIGKRAKKEGWTRDLSAKIKAKAAELVTRSLVTKSVTSDQAVNERQMIEAGAAFIAGVRAKHRQYNERLWTNTMRLMTESEAMSAEPELYTRLGELLSGDADVDMLRSAFRRAADFTGRVDANKKLAETMKLAQTMERETNDMAPVATKIDLTATVDDSRKLREMTDDELFAIAAGGGTRAADPSPSTN